MPQRYLSFLKEVRVNTCETSFKFIYNKTKNLLRHETLRVLGSSSAHHQEFIHCTLGTGICHTGLKTAFEQDHPSPARKLSTNLYNTCA